jgi:ribosomal protein L29
MADKKTTKAKATSKKAVEVKTLDQLQEELTKLQNEYRESRRSHQMGELVNPHVLTTQRKSIARSLTAIKQAETAATKEEN